MVDRLGTQADVLMTESVLGRILETIDSMLIEVPLAGVLLSGDCHVDDHGEYLIINGMTEEEGIGLCVGSSEGGIEPTDADLVLFKKKVGKGILMKVDVYAHQFSVFKINEEVEDATILFVE